jgi:nitroreductase
MRRFFLLVFAAVFIFCADAKAQEEKAKESVQQPRGALEVIYSRKSVRNYTGVPATREELQILLKAGMAAPSAVDRRPWAFVVVSDEKLLNKLAEGLPYSKMIVKAKAAIVVCGVLDKALEGEGQAFWVQDCSAATENILLAAEAIGLGAVWTGMYPSKERMDYVRSVLGMPDRVMPLNVIAVGNPAGVEKPKDKFDPGNIHWNKW